MNNTAMIIFRSLWRQKEFSFMNVLGLGVGIGSTLLIFLLIRNELSFDTFHHQRERIYRVVSTETYRNGIVDFDGCAPMPLGDALGREFPQVETEATCFEEWGQLITIPGEKGESVKKFKVNTLFAEPSLFRIFDFTWLQGDPLSSLGASNTVVLTRSVAAAWFGHWQNAVGKTILWRGDHQPLLVTGILEDPPVNTDIPLNVVFSFATFRKMQPEAFTDPLNWDNFSASVQCYFLLKQNATIQSMNALLPGFVERHYTPLFAHSDTRDSSFFQPLKEVHFDERFSRYGSGGLSYTELWSLGCIGLFLILVACINFINLATGLSLRRAKEVGVRKVLGGSKQHLFFRFLQETALLVVFALVLGCILAELAQRPLEQLMGKDIPAGAIFSPAALAFLLGTGILVTVLSGAYPGLVLARFNPARVLKGGGYSNPGKGHTLRSGLVIFQFVIAQLLIIGTLVVVRQMHFFATRPMGFDRKAIALVAVGDAKRNEYFKERVLAIPGVSSASLCSQAPATDGSSSTAVTLKGHPYPEDFEVTRRFGDADYMSTFRIPLLAGRMPYTSDSATEAVLNLEAVKKLGFRAPQDILGQYIQAGGSPNRYIPVVGVVSDFNLGPLREQLKPMLLVSDTSIYWNLAIRIDPAKIPKVMEAVRKLHGQVYPEQLFESTFLDDDVISFYHAEAVTSKLFALFAALAIFISCLGLYGLVSFMTAQKTKEVGIRKVLGASVRSIVLMFSREFTILIVIAFLIAVPLGYYLMNKWLSGFYYRKEIDGSIFAMTVLVSILIAWATVGYQAIRAALANPARSLRTE